MHSKRNLLSFSISSSTHNSRLKLNMLRFLDAVAKRTIVDIETVPFGTSEIQRRRQASRQTKRSGWTPLEGFQKRSGTICSNWAYNWGATAGGTVACCLTNARTCGARWAVVATRTCDLRGGCHAHTPRRARHGSRGRCRTVLSQRTGTGTSGID